MTTENEHPPGRPHRARFKCKRCGEFHYLWLREDEWVETLPKRYLYATCNRCLRKQSGPLMQSFIDKLRTGL